MKSPFTTHVGSRFRIADDQGGETRQELRVNQYNYVS